jgi:hypothetical protein
MSYMVSITVINAQTKAPIKGASISDGDPSNISTTDALGVAKFTYTPPPDDPPIDNLSVSDPDYGTQYLQIDPDETTSYTVWLQPLPAPGGGSNSFPPPYAPELEPQPATIQDSNRIAVRWGSSYSYDKYLIWWFENGVAKPQGEVDSGGITGSWTAEPTIPGAVYSFEVEGGVKNLWGILGYIYSGWSTLQTVTAVPNLTSLKAFLQTSGVSLPQNLRALMSPQTSVKTFMKLN